MQNSRLAAMKTGRGGIAEMIGRKLLTVSLV
jgi:hypothetical protein